MAENKVNWANFSFAQRYFKLESSGKISGSVTPIGVSPLPPSVTPEALAAMFADVLKPVGFTRKLIEDELLESEDQPSGLEYIKDLAHFIVKGVSKLKDFGR